MNDRVDELRQQYGCGPVQFSGADEALYNRHLLFDDVIDPLNSKAPEPSRYGHQSCPAPSAASFDGARASILGGDRSTVEPEQAIQQTQLTEEKPACPTAKSTI